MPPHVNKRRQGLLGGKVVCDVYKLRYQSQAPREPCDEQEHGA